MNQQVINSIKGYVKPVVNDEDVLQIKNGRHPVVEHFIQEKFVPNDTFVNTDTDQLLIITGPNMAGKSTYMRQTALMSLMAQVGSFVPAKEASLPICDRIFTLAFGRITGQLPRGEATQESLMKLMTKEREAA